MSFNICIKSLLIAFCLFVFSSCSPSHPGDSVAPPVADDGRIPEYNRWTAEMLTWGQHHCNRLNDKNLGFDPRLAATYYDAAWVYYQIADFTRDSSWNSCAAAALRVYRDEYVIPAEGIVPGFWNFTRGLAQDYHRTGNSSSKNAVRLLANNAAFARDVTPASETEDAALSREVAYAIISYLDAEEIGEPARARLGQLVSQSLGHLDQWFVHRSAPFVRPFMVGLTSQALIEYYERSGDQRILPALINAADSLWDETWVEGAQAFMYTDRHHESGGQEPAADLNLLIAPMYAWLYKETGNARFRNRADDIFAGGVRGAYLNNAKQFNQNYRWSFSYLEWRAMGDRKYRGKVARARAVHNRINSFSFNLLTLPSSFFINLN